MSDKWQPIETAPKDGTAMWLWCEGSMFIGYCDPANGIFRDADAWILKSGIRRRPDGRGLPDEVFGTYVFDANPTDWMPLPAPPSPTTTGKGE